MLIMMSWAEARADVCASLLNHVASHDHVGFHSLFILVPCYLVLLELFISGVMKLTLYSDLL